MPSSPAPPLLKVSSVIRAHWSGALPEESRRAGSCPCQASPTLGLWFPARPVLRLLPVGLGESPPAASERTCSGPLSTLRQLLDSILRLTEQESPGTMTRRRNSPSSLQYDERQQETSFLVESESTWKEARTALRLHVVSTAQGVAAAFQAHVP